MTALVLGLLALLAASAALVIAYRTRRDVNADLQMLAALLDDEPTAAAPIERESIRDYSIVDDVGRALAARKRAAP